MPAQSRPASADSNCRTVVTTSFAAPLTEGVSWLPLRRATSTAAATTATTASVASATVLRRLCTRSHPTLGQLYRRRPGEGGRGQHNYGHGGIGTGLRGDFGELATVLPLLVAEPRGPGSLRGCTQGRPRDGRGGGARRGGAGGGGPVPRLPSRPTPPQPHVLRGERPPDLAHRGRGGPLGADGGGDAVGGVVHG